MIFPNWIGKEENERMIVENDSELPEYHCRVMSTRKLIKQANGKLNNHSFFPLSVLRSKPLIEKSCSLQFPCARKEIVDA